MVIFGGTFQLGEALAIVLQYVNDDISLQQHLVRVQMLSKSLTDEEIAWELVTVLAVMYSVHPNNLLGTMRGRAWCFNVNFVDCLP